jgi:hypothetical protein
MWDNLLTFMVQNPGDFWSIIFNAITALITLTAVVTTLLIFRNQIASEHYGEIDKIYFDLLHILVGRPHLRSGEAAHAANATDEYDAFAFMMWNFIETIYDRCDGRIDLERTWQPIVEVEGVNHLDWLVQPQNIVKFKSKFIGFLAEGGFHKHCRNAALADALRAGLANKA